MSRRPPKTIHRLFIVFYILGIGAVSSIPVNIITSVVTKGPSALDPRLWQTFYLVQLMRQYPVPASAVGLAALISMILGRQFQIIYNREAVLADPNSVGQVRARQSMLNTMQHLVQRQIDESLHGESMIAIRTRDMPELVPYESRQFTQPYFAQAANVRPSEPTIEDLASANESLLILGDPGAGKTLALLQCAQALVSRALNDGAAPIPVLFNLSTWAQRRKPLAEWMVAQLNRPPYFVPEQLASVWVASGLVQPLLDGLDEVPAPLVGDCIRAINAYRPISGIRPAIIVCCRLEDYKPHAQALAVQRVVLIEPLSPEQIAHYLANPQLEGLRNALAHDEGLSELAQTPLMLSLMALTLQHVSAPSILLQQTTTENTFEQRQRTFFERYVKIQLTREYRHRRSRYKMDDTLRWLSWLANVLNAHNDVRFYVETLQPRLLKNWAAFLITIIVIFGLFDGALFGSVGYWVYGLNVALIVGIASFLFGSFFGALGGKGMGSIGLRDRLKVDSGTIFVTLIYGSVFGIAVGLVYGLAIGVAVGAVLGIIGGLFGSLGSIPLPHRRKIDISGFAVGFIMGYAVYPVYGAIPSLVVGFLIGLGIGFAFGSVLDLANSTSQALRDAGYVRVNSGMIRTRNYGIAFGMLCGGVTGIAIGFAYGVVFGLGVGFVCGLVVGFGVGLGDYIKYCFLRVSMAIEGDAPLFYVRFLDEAKDRAFLRRSGGGYEFVHRLIREYFASLHPEYEAFFTKRDL
ncbi:MAG TPA: hypothetical protein VFN61_00280 [Acidimicrobiales bacterium]|nr:hypothetical protein [Acidimicrobiales bacterium]